jgi:transcriptional regulator with XRE-family HTH domain
MSTDPESDRATLANRLKEAREYLDLSQEEVAKILKIPRSAISLIEKGERKVDALELKSFARVYQRSVDYFTGTNGLETMPEEVAHLARAASKLTEKDIVELTRFAEFLQSKAQ